MIINAARDYQSLSIGGLKGYKDQLGGLRKIADNLRPNSRQGASWPLYWT